MDTVPDEPAKTTALLYFHDIYQACRTIGPLTSAGAQAVELMDRASLRSIVHITGIPALIQTLPAAAAALLVEFQGITTDTVRDKVSRFLAYVHYRAVQSPPDSTQNHPKQHPLR